MSAAVERIVVQATAQDKKAIAAKARRLSIPVSELMRRGAFAYEADTGVDELAALADAARGASDRAGAAIEDALSFIVASNRRIAAMEAAAAGPKRPKMGSRKAA
ncbi:MAG: hypothetical protein H7Z19_05500 [Chitinophagaceae bacterium]|nr:hypothetical protein [Rubrivivax sp.]